MREEFTTVTPELIQQGASDVGGWTHRQFKLLGMQPNPPHGWKRKIIGALIPTKDAEEFVRLKNSSKAMQKKLKSTPPQEQKSVFVGNTRIAELEKEVAYYKRRYEELLNEMQESRLDNEYRAITAPVNFNREPPQSVKVAPALTAPPWDS